MRDGGIKDPVLIDDTFSLGIRNDATCLVVCNSQADAHRLAMNMTPAQIEMKVMGGQVSTRGPEVIIDPKINTVPGKYLVAADPDLIHLLKVQHARNEVEA